MISWGKKAVIALVWIGLCSSSAFAGHGHNVQPAQPGHQGPQQPDDLDNSMENSNYPIHPDDQETPGDICSKSNTYRYPEHIKYCDRNVSSSTKNQIIAHYDQVFGYKIGSSPRGDYKIDHLIPLCLGGSNEVINLWPQHKSVYAITDPMEPEICNKLSQGKILQKDAIDMIVYAKHHLGEVDEILAKIRAL